MLYTSKNADFPEQDNTFADACTTFAIQGSKYFYWLLVSNDPAFDFDDVCQEILIAIIRHLSESGIAFDRADKFQLWNTARQAVKEMRRAGGHCPRRSVGIDDTVPGTDGLTWGETIPATDVDSVDMEERFANQDSASRRLWRISCLPNGKRMIAIGNKVLSGQKLTPAERKARQRFKNDSNLLCK